MSDSWIVFWVTPAAYTNSNSNEGVVAEGLRAELQTMKLIFTTRPAN